MIERYSNPEMQKVWSEEAGYKAWLKIEIAACRAYQKLGKKTIPSIIQESDPKMNELKELVENYDRNDLDLIQLSDHLVKREKLLRDLGLMYVEKTNQYDRGNKMTVPELASSLGFTKRSYQIRKQISTTI